MWNRAWVSFIRSSLVEFSVVFRQKNNIRGICRPTDTFADPKRYLWRLALLLENTLSNVNGRQLPDLLMVVPHGMLEGPPNFSNKPRIRLWCTYAVTCGCGPHVVRLAFSLSITCTFNAGINNPRYKNLIMVPWNMSLIDRIELFYGPRTGLWPLRGAAIDPRRAKWFVYHFPIDSIFIRIYTTPLCAHYLKLFH